MLALFAAMPVEAGDLIDQLKAAPPLPGGFPRFSGRLAGRPVELVLTGPGKANAAAAAASCLASQRPDAILQFGCGGAYPQAALNIGDLALATCEILLDEGSDSPEGFLDFEDLGLPLVERPAAPLYNRFDFDSALVDELYDGLRSFAADNGISCGKGPFVTVSTCTGTDEQARQRWQDSLAVCENMEGAALALVAARFGVPMVELRGISNIAARRQRDEWDIPGACRNVRKALRHLLARWPGETHG